MVVTVEEPQTAVVDFPQVTFLFNQRINRPKSLKDTSPSSCLSHEGPEGGCKQNPPAGSIDGGESEVIERQYLSMLSGQAQTATAKRHVRNGYLDHQLKHRSPPSHGGDGHSHALTASMRLLRMA